MSLILTRPLTKKSIILEDPGVGVNNWTIQAPTLAASYTLTLPVNDGDSGEVLQTDGSGVLSWVSNTSSAEFADNVFRINDNDTPSKQIAFEASGITASNIRTITMPDDNVNLTNAGLMDQTVATGASVTFASITDGTATLTSGGISGLTNVNSVTATELSQLEAIGATTISAAQWGYVGALDQALTTGSSVSFTSVTDGTATLTSGGITGLTAVNSVTATELSQLETIGATTIDATQWGYVGALDQGLTTGSTVSFTSVGDGTATMTGGLVTAKITTNGAFKRKISAVTAAATLDGTQHVISASTSASYAITLPDCATNAGIEYSIIYASSGGAFTITVTCAGSDTIDDDTETTIVLVSEHDRVKLLSLGGTVWYTNI